MAISFDTIELAEGTLHFAQAGRPGAPLLLCLHGFPESWLAWEAVMEQLGGRFHVVAPDQRGFNRTFKPGSVEAYHARHLSADMFALADWFQPDAPFALAGHDWGSAVAYAMAFYKPQRISHLVIANGVHPWCFQNAILNDRDQRAASQYMNRLREADAEKLLSANGYEKLMNMMAGFSSTAWLTPELKAAYVEQWSQPGALDAMLNWYRASPVVVPGMDEGPRDAPVMAMREDVMRVHMPHLVLWGDADTALRPICIEGIERFAPDLTLRHIKGASHWILHEQPDVVSAAMLDFLVR